MNIYQVMWMSKEYEAVSAIGLADDWEDLEKYVKKTYHPLEKKVIILGATESNLYWAKREGQLIIDLKEGV